VRREEEEREGDAAHSLFFLPESRLVRARLSEEEEVRREAGGAELSLLSGAFVIRSCLLCPMECFHLIC